MREQTALNSSMKNTNNTVGSAKADIVAGIIAFAGIVADFVRSKDSKDFRFLVPLADLPWENPTFCMKLIQAAGGAITWRSGTSLKVLPEAGGVVDAATFVKAVLALDFRGDEKPNAEDIKNAKTVLNYSEQAPENPGIIKAQVLKEYGWEVEVTLEGLAQHMMKKRQKLNAAKQADPLSLLS